MKRRQLIWYLLLFSFGCTTGVNTPQTRINKATTITPKTLKFAVTDISGIAELQREFGAFKQALEKVLDISIEFFPVDNYTAAVPAMLSGKIDIAFAGPSEYLILKSRAKVVPIIGIERPNYHSIIIVKANSQITSLSQLKGKKIAMFSVGSTSGHIVPTKLLIDAGLDPKTDIQILMLKEKGAKALQDNQVDAWAIASDKYENILQQENLDKQNFSIIATSPLLPSDLFVASNQLAGDFIESIKSRMLQNQDKLMQSLLIAKANDKYKGGKFINVNDQDYSVIEEVYEKIGQSEFLK
ncbi:MAG TPA: phosphate/phosphite/phosphonate ABC transporter substrate-binding protein [Nostocaceae cyanobacterium]|nr:phosphate/phosphite/phosphonate ABC transporter substrate-binding protein [Nostocaceae cyanobacterium]